MLLGRGAPQGYARVLAVSPDGPARFSLAAMEAGAVSLGIQQPDFESGTHRKPLCMERSAGAASLTSQSLTPAGFLHHPPV